MGRPMRFHDFTVRLDGEIEARQVFDTDLIERRPVEVFSEMLQERGPYFRDLIPSVESRDVELSWLCSRTAALAMFATGGKVLSISVLLSGQDEQTDTQFLGHFREMLAEETVSRTLPAPELATITERPLVLSLPLPSQPDDLARAGELLMYLATAFFELAHERARAVGAG